MCIIYYTLYRTENMVLKYEFHSGHTLCTVYIGLNAEND